MCVKTESFTNISSILLYPVFVNTKVSPVKQGKEYVNKSQFGNFVSSILEISPKFPSSVL